MASLCGRLGLVTPRDAFITAICKASLPPHYALTVLSSSAANLSSKGTTVHIRNLKYKKKTENCLGCVPKQFDPPTSIERRKKRHLLMG